MVLYAVRQRGSRSARSWPKGAVEHQGKSNNDHRSLHLSCARSAESRVADCKAAVAVGAQTLMHVRLSAVRRMGGLEADWKKLGTFDTPEQVVSLSPRQ